VNKRLIFDSSKQIFLCNLSQHWEEWAKEGKITFALENLWWVCSDFVRGTKKLLLLESTDSFLGSTN
jgi:hypothetical protein